MITYEWLYILAGIFFAIWAVLSALDRSNGKRWGNAAFWGLLAVSFLFGSHFTPLLNGVLVLALVAIAGVGGLGRSDPPTTTLEERFKLAELKGNRLFVPALIVPFVAVAGTLAYNYTPLSGTGLFEVGGNSSNASGGTKISNIVFITSIADADVEECELYLRQYYRGIPAGSTTYTAGKFVAELEIQASH